jgi:hypothetical protein
MFARTTLVAVATVWVTRWRHVCGWRHATPATAAINKKVLIAPKHRTFCVWYEIVVDRE